MTDKVQKIREKVVEMVNSINPFIPDEDGKNSDYEAGKLDVASKILQVIDSLQEEPVSIWHDASEKPEHNDLLIETNDGRIIHRQSVNNYGMVKRWAYTSVLLNLDNSCNLKNNSQEEPVSEDLGDYINELSKQFPEVSFTKLSRIAVRVAKWQEEQFEKNRLAHCDAQTEEEAEREWNFCMSILNYEHRQPTYDDAIKYGMRLQKEQMLAKAIDVDVVVDRICEVVYLCPHKKEKTGDKVKVIVIKED